MFNEKEKLRVKYGYLFSGVSSSEKAGRPMRPGLLQAESLAQAAASAMTCSLVV